MLDKDIIKLIKALVPRATQKQYIAFAEYERTRSLEERAESAALLDDLNAFFKEGMRKQSEEALARQQKRNYEAKFKILGLTDATADNPNKTKKRERFFARPAIFANKMSFACANPACGKVSAPFLAPKHKTPDGWDMWCMECGIPEKFREKIRTNDKNYALYEEWRAENLKLGTHLKTDNEDDEKSIYDEDSEPETH
jgi:hypothetical protein